MTQPVNTLSGGQAVRVALAGIAMQAPHLLVLDEPSNHLDMVRPAPNGSTRPFLLSV